MKRFILHVLLLLILAAIAAGPVSAQASEPPFILGPQLVIYADPQPSTLNIPAPAFGPRLDATTIIVTFQSPGAVDPAGFTCQAFPIDAQNAYQFAISTWANYLNSSVPVRISACWTSMGGGVLGSSGPYLTVNSFPGQTQPNTKYPFALADSLAHADLFPGYYDIISDFNSDFTGWYFGTDGTPPFNTWDFASVVLHETGHGLGFSGSMSNGSGPLTYSSVPYIYDRFTENSAGTALLNLPNGGSELASALTSAVYFDGPNADAAYGGLRIPLFSPNPWMQGSSYSHLSTIFDGTPNALMTYSLSNGEVVHNPGPVTLGILQDLGWSVTGATPAAPSNLSAVLDAITPASKINLSWTDNSNNESGFEIYRSTDNVNWSPVATTAANTTSYPDGGLRSGTRYFYRVRAINGAGGSAFAYSSPAITSGPPPAPTALTALAIGETKILLTWTDNSNIETGFIVERQNGPAWDTLATTGPNITTFTDAGRVKNSTYTYRVRAASLQGESANAGPVSATTWSFTYWTFLSLVAR